MTRALCTAALLATVAWPALAVDLLVAGTPVQVGPGSGEVFLVDLNRDGRLDLVTKHLLQRVISVALGSGDGRFAAPTSIALAFEPGAITLGDLTSDGIPDLIVANKDATQELVRVLRGTGNGTFAAAGAPLATAPAIPFYKPFLHIADTNGDGHADVVSANGRRNTVEVLLGDGAGALRPGPVVTLDPGMDFYSHLLWDVNGDKRVDLVTAGRAADGRSGLIVPRFNDGRGGFRTGARMQFEGEAPKLLGFGDVDGDDAPDAIIGYAERNDVTVLINFGGLLTPDGAGRYRTGAEGFDAVVGDVNGDGLADILTANGTSVTALVGSRAGFAGAAGSPYRVGPGAYNLAAGDLNGDGKADVVISSFEGVALMVLLGQ